MTADHHVHVAGVGLMQGRRADPRPGQIGIVLAERGSERGGGSVGDPQHAGVHQREELPGSQRGWARHQAVDPAANIGVEVEVGIE